MTVSLPNLYCSHGVMRGQCPNPVCAALFEVADETFRSQVEAEKVRIRERLARPWWRNLFPYRITITRL